MIEQRAPLRVAYILHRFPHLTETFIAREMFWVRRHAIDVDVFSLMKARHGSPSKESRALEDRTHYSRTFSRGVLEAHLRFLKTRPGAYVRALARLVCQTFREPGALMLALALFPRFVHFADVIEQRGIHHVHANFVWMEGLAAGVVRDLTGIGFTLHPHAFGLFGRNPRAVRNQLENASHVVAISDYHRRYIRALCPGLGDAEITVIHCGVSTSDFKPGASGVRSAPVRILSVGRAMEKKGHEYLVDACGALRDRGLEFRCEIVLGPEDGRERLQSRIEALELGTIVTLLGAHDQGDLIRRYQASDIFVLACVVAADGDRDGIPVALMEAMACGLAVVTTPVAGIPDLVDHLETGILVPPRDSAALADELERLITDGDRSRLGQAARRAVQAGFEAEDNAAAMAALFRRVAPGAEVRA